MARESRQYKAVYFDLKIDDLKKHYSEKRQKALIGE